jgi:hypothetical protein
MRHNLRIKGASFDPCGWLGAVKGKHEKPNKGQTQTQNGGATYVPVYVEGGGSSVSDYDVPPQGITGIGPVGSHSNPVYIDFR